MATTFENSRANLYAAIKEVGNDIKRLETLMAEAPANASGVSATSLKRREMDIVGQIERSAAKVLQTSQSHRALCVAKGIENTHNPILAASSTSGDRPLSAAEFRQAANATGLDSTVSAYENYLAGHVASSV